MLHAASHISKQEPKTPPAEIFYCSCDSAASDLITAISAFRAVEQYAKAHQLNPGTTVIANQEDAFSVTKIGSAYVACQKD